MDDKETIFFSGEYISKRKWGMLVSCDYYPYTLFNQFISSAGFGVGCLFSRKMFIRDWGDMILNSIRLQIMLCRLIIHSVMVVFIIAFLHFNYRVVEK